MKIWLFCLFGNEEKLMPFFLRHYVDQVDRLVMLDGGCRDGSRALIEQWCNAIVEDSPFKDGGYDEIEFVRYLAERCKEARGRADWVLAVDADEFLYYPHGLRRALEFYRLGGERAIKTMGYQMCADKFPQDDGRPLTQLVTKGTRDPEYDKVAAFDPEIEIEWSSGRHNCRTSAEARQAAVKLLHYRYFGEEYLRERNALNYARRSEEDVRLGRGYHGSPEHAGKYSARWWQMALLEAEEVVR